MSLLEAAQDARHDLGKYVCMNQRWLGSDPARLLEALQADVLHTRKGPTGSESAMQLWARLRPSLVGANIQGVDQGIAILVSAEAGLRDGSISLERQRQCQEACALIQSTLRDLTRSLAKEL